MRDRLSNMTGMSAVSSWSKRRGGDEERRGGVVGQRICPSLNISHQNRYMKSIEFLLTLFLFICSKLDWNQHDLGTELQTPKEIRFFGRLVVMAGVCPRCVHVSSYSSRESVSWVSVLLVVNSEPQPPAQFMPWPKDPRGIYFTSTNPG